MSGFRGAAGQGSARLCTVRPGIALLGKAAHGKDFHDRFLGKARLGWAAHGKAGIGWARRGEARQRMDWLGATRTGRARRGMARIS